MQSFKNVDESREEIVSADRVPDKNGRLVPVQRKAIKKDDEEKETVAEETHRVSVTVTDPHHPATTMRSVKHEKRIRVSADSQENAVKSAIAHYQKRGYKVHDQNYIGVHKEEVEHLDDDIAEGASGYKPGWMLKADPELGKKVKAKQDQHKAMVKAMGNPNAGKSVKEDLDEVDENYVSHAQRKAVWAARKDGGKGHPDNKKKVKEEVELDESDKAWAAAQEKEKEKKLTPNDQDKLAKVRALMAKERQQKESVVDDVKKLPGDAVKTVTGVAKAVHKALLIKSPIQEDSEVQEAVDKQDMRMMQLARLGLVDKSDVARLRLAVQQLKSEKPLSVVQRTLLLNVFEDLMSLVTGDDQVFMRIKRDVQKEATEKNDPPFDGPYKKVSEPHKDRFGNVIKTRNVARHLAKLALQKQQQKLSNK